MNPISDQRDVVETPAEFGARAEAWISLHLERRPNTDGPKQWGKEFGVAS